MSERYEMWTPAQAVDRLAADLPGGRTDAEQVVASYLRDATGVHGRPSLGWRLDEFDLDDACARFGWVDFAGGETVAQARARADAAAVAALSEARGTSAITERDRLAGLHSDAEMWGYRAHRVGLDELTNTTGCDPQPRLVTVAREGRERSHREAVAAHDARVAAAEAAATATALTGQHQDQNNRDQEDDVHTPNDRPPAEIEEPGDRERVLAEGHGASVGGMWLTPDETAEDGVRPLTEAEARRFSDLVRASQAEAVADQLDDAPAPGRAPSGDGDGAGWER
jgi:hypothetical protein